MFVHPLLHCFVEGGVLSRPSCVAEVVGQIDHLQQGFAIQIGDEQGLRACPQVDGVVPVGEPEQRQPMGACVLSGELDGPTQVIENRA